MATNPLPVGGHPTVPPEVLPAPRRPGARRRPWWEFGVPLLTTVLAAALSFGVDWMGVFSIPNGPVATLTVLTYLATTIALGYSLGRRDPSDRFARDLFRGAFTAELMTLGMTALFVLWNQGSLGSMVKALPWAVVLAHVFCLPVLCGAAGLGVSLGSAAGVTRS